MVAGWPGALAAPRQADPAELDPRLTEAAVDDFGRWHSVVQQCRMGPEGAAVAGCEAVRLDQQLAGLLTVRFLGQDRGPRGVGRLLVFAGLLEPGSPALQCREGRCERQGVMRMRVSVLADQGFEGNGQTLPRSRLAEGRCEILPSRVRCQATPTAERPWRAEAKL